MVVKYNSLNRLEKPMLTLCNPGSVYNNGVLTKVVGILTDHEAEEVVFNFNATSELNFRVNKICRDNADENLHIDTLYRAIQNRRLIFLEGIGYFVITGTEDGYADGVHYKDIKAQSADIEIQQKMIPFIENGTYRFSTSGDDKGILETIVETLPLWTIGGVDASVSNKWRTFEDVDVSTNCLAFLLNNIQDAYECIVVFDILNRIINVYDQSNYVEQTDIHITKNDLVNSIGITENAEDLYTAISVFGDSDVTISAINPLGTSVIYDFSYYLDWMSPSLRTKVIAWQNAINAAKDTYYQNSLTYYQKLKLASDNESEIKKIDIQMTLYQRCRDNIVAESSTALVSSYNQAIRENGGDAIIIYEEISDTLDQIDALLNDCAERKDFFREELSRIEGELEEVNNEISITRDSLAIANYFNQNQRDELCNYIYEGKYEDEYVIITDVMSYEEKFAQAKTLYDRAMLQLEKVSTPTQEFNIDVENFVFVKSFEHWSEQLETGCLINVELDEGDIAQLFLSSMTINYDDHKLSMTFGNRFNKFDPKSLFDDVLGNISKSANTLNYIKDVIYPIKSGQFNAMKDALQNSRNLTMNAALASTGEEVVIDSSGYTGKRLLEGGIYDPKQVKLTGKSLVFTDDAWETCKVALGELLFGNATAYGINAEAIIGDIIIGNNLHIKDNNGNDLLTVVDGKINARVSNVEGDVTELQQGADNINIRVESLEDSAGEVDHVRTTTGYTFDADGLTISKDGEEMINLLDNTGMFVKRRVADGEENVLTANNEGVKAINLSARQFLIVGEHSRFENYGTNRTACFYIG